MIEVIVDVESLWYNLHCGERCVGVWAYGESEIASPRGRNGEHGPLIVKKHQENMTGIEEKIIALYSKGMIVRDIQDHLSKMYGVEISPTLISNFKNKLMSIIKEWQSRPLE